MRVSKNILVRFVVVCMLTLNVALAHAWPDRTVRLIVPAPPGGVFDAVARLFAEYLGKESGQSVIVENKPGGVGAIAVQYVLGAAPDGDTLLFTGSNILTEIPHVVKLPYDPLKDLRAFPPLAAFRFILVGSPDLPAKDMASLGKYLQASAGTASFASAGRGTLSHYSGVMLNQRFGTDMQHIPFTGAPPAELALMNRTVTIFLDGVMTATPLLRTGKLKAFGISGTTRDAQLPNVPTFAEQGYPQFANFSNSLFAVASPKVPAPVAEQIEALSQKIAASPQFRERVAKLGIDPAEPMSGEQFAKQLRSEYDWAGDFARKLKLVKQ